MVNRKIFNSLINDQPSTINYQPSTIGTTIINLFLFLILSSCAVQKKQDSLKFNKLSKPEKKWVLAHPFVARKAAILTSRAQAISKEMEKDKSLDGINNGGQVDAFRHAYWMALLAQKINHKKVFKLGLAHEQANKLDFKNLILEEGIVPDSISSVMDISNNKIGVAIGCNNANITEGELKDFVKKEILNGKMKIIRKDGKGNFLDCEGNVIDMNIWKDKWAIPKCLVGSN